MGEQRGVAVGAILRRVLDATARKGGQEYFTSLVTVLAGELGMPCASVMQVSDDGNLKVLGRVEDAELTFDAHLAMTDDLFKETFSEGKLSCPSGAAAHFPDNDHISRLGSECCFSSALRDSNGKVCGVLAVADVRPAQEPALVEEVLGVLSALVSAELGRRAVAEELRESEERFKTIFENSPLGMVMLDQAGDVRYANNSFLRLSGLDAGRCKGMRFSDIFTPEGFGDFHSVFSQLASGGCEGDHVEWLGTLTGGGAERFVSVHASIAYQSGENPPYTLLHILDDTDRKMAEQAVSRIANEWKYTFDAMSDMVMIVDKGFNVVRANMACASLAGVHPRELVGRKCHLMMHKTNGAWDRCPHDEAMKKCEIVTREVYDEKMGIPMLVTCAPYFDEAGNVAGSIHVARDISEQKRSDEAREKLIGELRSAVSKLKILSGLLPICASCKSIRDDKGYWQQLEWFISEHSDATFSHGICPDCAKKLYPEFVHGAEPPQSEDDREDD